MFAILSAERGSTDDFHTILKAKKLMNRKIKSRVPETKKNDQAEKIGLSFAKFQMLRSECSRSRIVLRNLRIDILCVGITIPNSKLV